MGARVQNRERVVTGGRNRKPRPKTFLTKEAAEGWAKRQGLKEFKIVNLKLPESKKTKFRVN